MSRIPSDKVKYMKLIELQNRVKKQNEAPYITLAVLSNINFEPYFQLLINNAFSRSCVSVKTIPIDYMEFLSGSIDKKLIETDVIAVIPNFDALYQNICYQSFNQDNIIKLCEAELLNTQNAIIKIRSQTNAQIIWFSYEDYFSQHNNVLGFVPYQNRLVDKLNLQISATFGDDIVYIDTKRLNATIGISNAYDNKNKYRWNSPYSQAMIEQICNEIHKQYLIAHGVTKKCIVLDCDNVLWGGILSEDGIENVHIGSSGLGRSYQDFQRYLLLLYNHGVILTVCSKNDISDVMRMFYEHSEMLLKEEHIASFQVNWDHKADNIRRIADTLNIGLNSMVFIDDSDFEVESIKQLLPEVTAIKYERDKIYSELSCFNLRSNVDIEHIRQRNNTYKTNKQRVNLKESSKSFEDYLNALDTKIDIHPALTIEYARIAELTQRTNKCSNGKRYTVTEIKERVSSASSNLYSVSVSDRFSDLGLVGAFEVDSETLTLFCLSCRALGRDVENKMLKFIADKYEILKFEFRSTGKNEVIKSLLSEAFSNAAITHSENI